MSTYYILSVTCSASCSNHFMPHNTAILFNKLEHTSCGGTSFFLILCESTATSSSISLCKLFHNRVSVNQDGVPWTNPLLATPNIWCRNPGSNQGPLDEQMERSLSEFSRYSVKFPAFLQNTQKFITYSTKAW